MGFRNLLFLHLPFVLKVIIIVNAVGPDDDAPTWVASDPLPNARVMPDAIILSCGRILYVNGAGWGMAGGDAGDMRNAGNPVFQADLYDPEAPAGSRWTSMAPATQMRLYHSGVILIETGEVVTTG